MTETNDFEEIGESEPSELTEKEGEQPEAPLGSVESAPTSEKRSLKWVWFALGGIVLAIVLVVGAVLGIRALEKKQFEQGKQAMSVDDWSAAVQGFDSAIGFQPSGLLLFTDEAIALRGIANFNLGKLDEAKQDLDTALGNNPGLNYLHAYRSLIFFREKDTQKAVQESDFVIEDPSEVPEDILTELYAHRAQVFFERENYESAMEESGHALEAVTQIPESLLVDLYLNRASVFLEQGEIDKALQEGRLTSEMDDSKGFPYAIEALQHYQALEYDEALVDVDAALERESDLPLASRIQGSVLAWQFYFDEAIAALDEALVANPDDVDALAMKVYVLLHQENDAESETVVEKILEVAPEEAMALWAQGLLKYYHFDLETSFELVDKAISLDDSRPEYYWLRGASRRGYSQEELARQDYEQALELDPEFVMALSRLARMENDRYEMNKQEEIAQKILAITQKYNGGYLLLADYYEYLNDYDTALDYSERAIDSQPYHSSGYLSRGFNYLDMEDYDLAKEDFERALKMNPISRGALSGLAWISIDNEDYEEAIEYFNRILEIDPNNQTALLRMAYVYTLNDDLQNAWEMVNQVAEVEPDWPFLLSTRAMLYEEEGNYEHALADLDRTIEVQPKNDDAHVSRARIFIFDGDIYGARRQALKALEINPKALGALFWMIVIESNEYNFEKVLEYAEEFLALETDDAWVYTLLGEAQIELGKVDEALESYQESIAINPEIPETYLDLALLYQEIGEVELAIENLEKVLELSEDPEMIMWAEDILASLARIPPAVDGFRTVVDEVAGYTITYPEDWQYSDSSDPNIKLILFAPEERGTAFINLTLSPNDGSAPSSKFFADLLVEVLSAVMENYNEISLKSVNVSGFPGYEHVFEGYALIDEVYYDVRVKHYYVVTQDFIVAIGFQARVEDYDRLIDEFEQMVASFELLK